MLTGLSFSFHVGGGQPRWRSTWGSATAERRGASAPLSPDHGRWVQSRRHPFCFKCLLANLGQQVFKGQVFLGVFFRINIH